jgi:predicted metal-dependent phosphoesterase TrpH
VLIDLHTHSNASDGTDSPAVLLAKAKTNNLSVVALTDHDTDQGWEEAEKYLPNNLQLVLGAEFSASDNRGKSVHIVGLMFDNSNSTIQEIFTKVKESRFGRAEQIVKRMEESGIPISFEELLDIAPPETTIGRPHIADLLVKKGIAKNRDEVFSNLLGNDSPFYIAHWAPSTKEVISAISNAGGVSILAHPRSTWKEFSLYQDNITNIVNEGLDGIEVAHRDHSEAAKAEVLATALEYDLVQVGSSDYHGNGKLNRLAENSTNPEQWYRLVEIAHSRKAIQR